MKAIKLLIFVLLAVYSCGLSSLAQQPEKPALVVVISIDPLNQDWLNLYKESLSSGGILKLLSEGQVCQNAKVGHALGSRSSALASISTGATPSIHGIVGDSWYDRLKQEEVYSTEDYLAPAHGAAGALSKNSPKRLLSTTLGDEILMANLGKLVSISIEADAAILSGGHLKHSCFWFDTYSGNWISNKVYMEALPQWLIDFNNRNHPDQYMSKEWDLVLAESNYAKAQPDDSPFEMGLLGEQTRFPYRMRRLSRNVTKGEYEVIANTPFGNTMTADFTIAAIYNEQLGLDKQTDLLNICFTSLQGIIRKYGPESREFMDALIRLDMEIQHLLYVLNEQIGNERLLIVLTGTHGSSWNADLAQSKGSPSGRFRARNAIALLNSFLSAIHGENYWIESYINQQIYLDQTLIDREKIPINQIQDQAARFMRQFEGVAEAMPADKLVSASISGPNQSVYQTAYNSNRSGDILLSLQPGWIQDGDYVSDHLSVYPYDQHIPMIWWGMNIQAGDINESVSLIDIIPTICAICSWPRPNSCMGTVIPIK